MGNLKGKKIALVYHNSAYGKEPIPTLEVLADKHGYELLLLPVDSPGQEQTATWLQVRRGKPDYVFLWGWGVMNQVAIKSATLINFPMDHMIGVWWSGSESGTWFPRASLRRAISPGRSTLPGTARRSTRTS